MLLNINKKIETSAFFVQNFPEMLKNKLGLQPYKGFFNFFWMFEKIL